MARGESSYSIVNEAQLYGWRDRVREIESEMKVLTAERQKLQNLIEMAERLANEAEMLAAATRGESHPGFINETLRELEAKDVFPKAIMAIVERREDGATYDEIREAILLSPLGDRFRKSDKGFYHALRRFKQSGALVEYHGSVFTPTNLAAFLKLVQAGLKEDKAVTHGGRATKMMDIILETIARSPGLVAKEIIANIRERDSELNERLSNNDGTAYNAIARFKKAGVVEGYGHLERQLRLGPNASEEIKALARSSNVVTMPKRTEAPNGSPAGASETDRGGNPDLFAQPAGTRQ